MCGRHHRLDPWLEAERLAHRRQEAGEERRAVAAAGDALKRHKVRWHWVKGHAGHDVNERADQLARDGVAMARLKGMREPPSAKTVIARECGRSRIPGRS